VLAKQVGPDGPSGTTASPHLSRGRRLGSSSVIGLSILFGLLYFVQGIVEPTEGLLSQPTKSLLRQWEHSAASAAWFAAILSFPWAIKPLYGLLTDFQPLGGSRRRSYLLLTTSVAFVGMTGLYFLPLDPTMALPLLLCLSVPAVAIAFSDVVVDALMVEVGQPRGLTGQLQSIQWASLYAATIFTGIIGGALSQSGLQQLGFLIAGLACGASLLAVWLLVRDPEPSLTQPAPVSRGEAKLGHLLEELRNTFRQRDILAIGAFLFLWNFNPFSATVLYYYSTTTLTFSEQFVGTLTSWQAVGGVIGCVGYGIFCRRIPVPWLIHGSIATGILATLTYWAYRDPTSGIIVSLLVGVVYAIGTIIQLDLAARVCRPETAGTTFALLMSLSNLSVALAQGLGGSIYATLADRWGAVPAFHSLVAVGALFTATCWLLAPLLTRAIASHGRSD
jgi:MFS family permease